VLKSKALIWALIVSLTTVTAAPLAEAKGKLFMNKQERQQFRQERDKFRADKKAFRAQGMSRKDARNAAREKNKDFIAKRKEVRKHRAIVGAAIVGGGAIGAAAVGGVAVGQSKR